MTIFPSPGHRPPSPERDTMHLSSASGGVSEADGGGKIFEFYLQMIFMANSSLAAYYFED